MDTISESNVYSKTCPTRELLDRIADKWTTLVIGILSNAKRPVRFGELRREIQGISQKMLTQTLRDLERDGLVVRAVYPVIPPRVEYSLTPLGRTLDEPLRALAVWAQEHLPQVRAAQQAFDARGPAESGNPAA
jgi:DNA-binding HxlR family transcriptional regulator